MPIPDLSMPDYYSEEHFLSQVRRPEVKWSLWPRRCHSSGRRLWFTLAYRAQYIITGPGDPAIWTRWYSCEEMLVLKLKGY
jgi:hypothetical protein